MYYILCFFKQCKCPVLGKFIPKSGRKWNNRILFPDISFLNQNRASSCSKLKMCYQHLLLWVSRNSVFLQNVWRRTIPIILRHVFLNFSSVSTVSIFRAGVLKTKTVCSSGTLVQVGTCPHGVTTQKTNIDIFIAVWKVGFTSEYCIVLLATIWVLVLWKEAWIRFIELIWRNMPRQKVFGK
jgi:hypothetical protein